MKARFSTSPITGKTYFHGFDICENDEDVKKLYGKSIWDMTASELIAHKLDGLWVKLMEMDGDDREHKLGQYKEEGSIR